MTRLIIILSVFVNKALPFSLVLVWIILPNVIIKEATAAVQAIVVASTALDILEDYHGPVALWRYGNKSGYGVYLYGVRALLTATGENYMYR